MAYVTPRTWVTGEVVTSAMMNQDVRDNVSFLAASTLGYAQVTANQTGITSEVDLTGLSVTVTVGTSRRIRVSARVYPQSSVAGDAVHTNIKEGATTLQRGDLTLVTGGFGISQETSVILTPTAGSHTYKLTMLRAAGTGTVQSNAAATFPAFILVEDIGAA